MAKAGYKKQPTVWPTASFILIKFFQAVCCLLVLGVMGFFAFQLRNDHYPIPWQFISLAALSALSLLCVFVLGVFFCCRALNPMAAMVIEILLSILWAFGAGILGKGMGGNIIRACGVWRTPQGIAVCHLFKTVFAFCILGWFSMICSIILSSSVRRSASSHKYQPANPASLQQTTAYAPQNTIGQTAVPYGQGGTYKPHDDQPTYS